MNERLKRIANRIVPVEQLNARKFPRDLEAGQLSLPFSILEIENLNYQRAREHAPLLRVSPRSEAAPLRGCVLCAKGHALVLVEKGDELSERLFTIAHEVAHFVAHYLEPREKAIERLGSSVKAVLDGERAASESERIAGVLERCPIGFYHHVMPRLSGAADIESDADEIALEVLSPLSEVLENLKKTKQGAAEDIELLQRTFGLPAWAAERRAILARSKLRGRHGNFLAGIKDSLGRG